MKRWGLSLALAGALFLPALADQPTMNTWQDSKGVHVEIILPPDFVQSGQAEAWLSNLLSPLLSQGSADGYDQGDYEDYEESQSSRTYPVYQDGREPAGYYPTPDSRPYEDQEDSTSPNGAFPDKHDTWGGPPAERR